MKLLPLYIYNCTWNLPFCHSLKRHMKAGSPHVISFMLFFALLMQKPKKYCVCINPGGTSKYGGGGGGLDLTSSLEAKFGARSGQVHKIRKKIWEVLSPKDAKVGKKSQFWGHIWNSEGNIWGICHLYFWGKIWGSNKNLRGKIWCQAPRPSNMESPPGCIKRMSNTHISIIQ